MRSRDPRIVLEQALLAGDAVVHSLRGRSLEAYSQDPVLPRAVERQFEIIGEALRRAMRADPYLEQRLPEAPHVVGFRNMLAHGYDVVSDETVYKNATEDLPVLLAKLRRLLEEESPT